MPFTMGVVSRLNFLDDSPFESQCTENSENGNLAGDMTLLVSLESFCIGLFEKSNYTVSSIDISIKELESLNVRLDIANNEFQRLRNVQFIESRVYEEDELTAEGPQKCFQIPSEEKENSIFDIVLTGFKMVEKYYFKKDASNQLDIGFILQSKDAYGTRAMLHPIYSEEWHQYWEADPYEKIKENNVDKSETKISNIDVCESKYSTNTLEPKNESILDLNDTLDCESNSKPIKQQVDSQYQLFVDAPPPLEERDNEVVPKISSGAASESITQFQSDVCDILRIDVTNDKNHEIKLPHSEFRKSRITKGLFDSDDSDDNEDVFSVQKSVKEFLPRPNTVSFPLFSEEPPDLDIFHDKIITNITQDIMEENEMKPDGHTSTLAASEIPKSGILFFKQQNFPSVKKQLFYDDNAIHRRVEKDMGLNINSDEILNTHENNIIVFGNQSDEINSLFDNEECTLPFSQNLFEGILNEHKSDGLTNFFTSEKLSKISPPSLTLADNANLNDSEDQFINFDNNVHNQNNYMSIETNKIISKDDEISHNTSITYDRNIDIKFPDSDKGQTYREQAFMPVDTKFKGRKELKPKEWMSEVTSDKQKFNMEAQLQQNSDSSDFQKTEFFGTVNLLDCINKTRAKGASNRRPPTRYGRKAALKGNLISIDNGTCENKIETNTKKAELITDGVLEVKIETFKTIAENENKEHENRVFPKMKNLGRNSDNNWKLNDDNATQTSTAISYSPSGLFYSGRQKYTQNKELEALHFFEDEDVNDSFYGSKSENKKNTFTKKTLFSDDENE